MTLLPALWALLLLTFPATMHSRTVPRQDKGLPVPNEVASLAGTYTGNWVLFGIDKSGQPVKRMAWTDTMTASNPTVKNGQAFVSTVDEMKFEGGAIPSMKMPGTEGYYLAKDGALGEYYMEMAGKTTKMQRISKVSWVYAADANPGELAQLGFSKVVSGQHVVVKVVTTENGNETHRISRVTTVNWKDGEGKDRWIQYVSLQGQHVKH